MPQDVVTVPRQVIITDSRVISRIGYDPATKIMLVEFHSGAVWQYDKVYYLDFARVVSARSAGAEFNKRIRNRYTATKREQAREHHS